jgi:hypothetical protein
MKKITVKVSDDDFQSFVGDNIGFSTNNNEVSIHNTLEDSTGFGTRRIIGHFTSHVWVREIQPVNETRDEKKKNIAAIAGEKPEVIDKFTQQEISGRDPNERPDFGIVAKPSKLSLDLDVSPGGLNWFDKDGKKVSPPFNEEVEPSTGDLQSEILSDAEEPSEPLSPEEKDASFKELKKKYSSGKVKV